MGFYRSTLLLLTSWIVACTCDHDSVTAVGHGVYSRPESDSLSSVSLIPDKSTAIETPGKVVRFNYYSTKDGEKIKFEIWRTPDGGSSYTLFHQTTEITTEGVGYYSYTCSSEEQFFVIQGDVIGVALLGSSPLTYTVVDCTDISVPMSASGEFEEGDSTSFSNVGSDCRQYSVDASVLYDTADSVFLQCASLTADDGWQNITSPGYDGSSFYSIDIHKCWKITVDPDLDKREDFGIQVEILNFNFEDPYLSGDCNGDFLEIKDGDSVFSIMLNELCGSSVPGEIDGTQQDLYLRMHTDDNELTVGTGFNLQYRYYEIDPKSGVNVLIIVGVIVAVILIAGVIVVVVLWFRLKKQRDKEEKTKLKDNEVTGLADSDDDLESGSAHRTRRSRLKSANNKVSPQMLRREKSLYANPTSPTTKMVAHKDADLKGHIPTDERIPPPSQYQSPRKKNNTTGKHWSKLGAGVQLDS